MIGLVLTLLRVIRLYPPFEATDSQAMEQGTEFGRVSSDACRLLGENPAGIRIAATPVSASRRPVLASAPMRLRHSILLLCLLVSLPANSVMAAMMPLCLSVTEQSGGASATHEHAAGVQHGKHAHSDTMDICALVCEQCSACAHAALPPALTPATLLPISTARALSPDALSPSPAPTPPFRPPLHAL